jgi:hypothetical protein
LKYILLSRAKKNYGDYLIFERGVQLIKHLKPNTELIEGRAWEPLDSQLTLTDIKSVDAIVIPGGPGITRFTYPNIYPLCDIVFKYEIPVYFLGVGSVISPYWANKLEYSKETLSFLEYINKYAPIGVRDNITEKILNNTGMTASLNGCPAWYCLPDIGKQFENNTNIRQIIFSVPASDRQVVSFLSIIKKFRNKIPEVKCIVSFNRGLGKNNTSAAEYHRNNFIFNKAKLYGCDIIDMSYSTKNNNIYNESDLHIGFRVHTHIYFLSVGKPTFLLADDSRGVGVLQTIQTPGWIIPKYYPNSKIPKGLNMLLSRMPMPKNNHIYKLQKRLSCIPDIADNVFKEVQKEVDLGFLSFVQVPSLIKKYYEKKMKPYILNYLP